MDDNSDLVGLPPEEIVARLLERRPDGYGLDDGTGLKGSPRWWMFWHPKEENRAEAWRRYLEESDARRRPVERLRPEGGER